MEQRVQTVCLVILSAVALGAAMYWLRPIMMPFVLAVFIALGLGMLAVNEVRFGGDFAPAAAVSFALLLAELREAWLRRSPRRHREATLAVTIAAALALWVPIADIYRPQLAMAASRRKRSTDSWSANSASSRTLSANLRSRPLRRAR